MPFEPLGIRAVAEGVPSFTRALKSMDDAITTVGKSATALGKTWLDAGEQVNKAVLRASTAIIGGLGAAGGALVALATATAPLEGVIQAFDDLTDSAELAGDEVLASMKQATAGMLSNKDLMVLWNDAALKVGNTFAKQLPDQMELLTKAAIATDTDLKKVIDNYIKGIDSVSASQLASIGVQVSRDRAFERFAAIVGKEVKELTESQKQRAFLIEANRQLERTYGDMADITDLNVVKMRRLRTMFQDVKDEMGLALQPAFRELLDIVDRVAEFALPKLVAIFREHVVPNVENIVKQIGLFYDRLQEGFNIFEVFGQGLADTLGFNEETRQRMWGFIQSVGEAWFTLRDLVEENKEIILNAIKAIGTALAFAGVSRLIAGGISRLLSPLGLIITTVGALSLAWQTNFLGIRDVLEDFWETTGQDVFKGIIDVAQNTVPEALGNLLNVIVTEVVPGLQKLWTGAQPFLQQLWNFILERVIPAIGEVAAWIGTHLPPALDRAREWVETRLIPALQMIWDWAKVNLPIAFQAVSDFITQTVVPAFQNFWTTVQPILQSVIDFVRDHIWPVFQNLFTPEEDREGGIFDPLLEGLQEVMDGLPEPIQQLLTAIGGFFSAVGEGIPGFLEGFGTIVSYLSETLGPTVRTVVSAVVSLLTLLFSAGEKFIQKWQEYGPIWEAIWLGFLAVVQNFVVFISTIVDVIANLLSKDFEGALEAAILGLATFFNNVLAIFDTDLKEMADVWRTNIEMLATILAEIWDRIVETVKTKIDSFVGTVETGVENLVSGIKSLLGIESPSRVFKEIGEQIVGGLQAGLTAPQMAPAVATSNTVSTTNNFNLTVNTAAPTEPILQDFAMMKAMASRR